MWLRFKVRTGLLCDRGAEGSGGGKLRCYEQYVQCGILDVEVGTFQR